MTRAWLFDNRDHTEIKTNPQASVVCVCVCVGGYPFLGLVFLHQPESPDATFLVFLSSSSFWGGEGGAGSKQNHDDSSPAASKLGARCWSFAALAELLAWDWSRTCWFSGNETWPGVKTQTVPSLNIPIPTKIGSKMGGAPIPDEPWPNGMTHLVVSFKGVPILLSNHPRMDFL